MRGNKFPKEWRDFESRLKYISYIFEEKFPKYVIMASCVEHKLDWNYAELLLKLNSSSDAVLKDGSRDVQKLKKLDL